MEALMVFWLIMMIVFSIVELITIGLTSIWFAISSLLCLSEAAIGIPFWIQVVSFFGFSILLLIATRPLVLKYLNSRTQATNLDRVVGEKAVLTEAVCNLNGTGKVFVLGKEWTARSDNDYEIIEKGTLIEVVRISGVKLIVRRV